MGSMQETSLAHDVCQSESCPSVDLQNGPGLDSDPRDEARPSGHVGPGQLRPRHSSCQNAIWDTSSETSELRTCHVEHPREKSWMADKPASEMSASASACGLWDTFLCSDHNPVVAQFASADRILSERLKLRTRGEEATEQVCSDYDIMCHQVGARNSGICPVESHSRLICYEATMQPLPSRKDSNSNELFMMAVSKLDLGTALPCDKSPLCPPVTQTAVVGDPSLQQSCIYVQRQ